MKDIKETQTEVNGLPCRIWEKGEGEPLGFLAGLGGLQKWPPLLDLLAKTRRVIVPSLPGYPGALGHDLLDSQLDWVLAAQELLQGAGLAGCDLMGVSVGGSLAAEVAAIWKSMVKRLVLLAPLGLYDEAAPVYDVFTLSPKDLPGMLCADPEVYTALGEVPEGADAAEWRIEQIRAGEAAARMLWPLSNTRLEKRLRRIVQPTLLLWGGEDKVLAPSYAGRFAEAIPASTQVEIVPGAGHLADLDAPHAVSEAVRGFLDEASIA
ncbi:MAG: alpha/beta hydrolase [SAR324 cluster bacterium]|nr:alpha/beta hydrolase [SAR324 cluster bacterium]